MYYATMSQSHNWKQILHIPPVKACLLGVLSIFGCLQSSQVREDNNIASSSTVKPIDVDTSTAEKIGQEALEKIGYNEIINLSEKAGFVEQKMSFNVELASIGPVVASGFVRVFSRYALAAGVTSQADSPLPGPADIAAVGIIVIGLVDAALLDGNLIKSMRTLIVATGEATIPTTVATDVPDDRPPPCPRNEKFSPRATHNATGCTDKIGNIRCYSARHYPCAGAHTHGSLSYQEIRGNDCKQIIRKAVRCDGPFSVGYSCNGPTVECRSGGTEMQGIFEE